MTASRPDPLPIETTPDLPASRRRNHAGYGSTCDTKSLVKIVSTTTEGGGRPCHRVNLAALREKVSVFRYSHIHIQPLVNHFSCRDALDV